MLYPSPQAVLTGSTAMLARRELTVTGTCPLPGHRQVACRFRNTPVPHALTRNGSAATQVSRGRSPGSYDGKVNRQTRARDHSLMLQGPGGLSYQPEVYAVTKLPDQVNRDVVVIGGCGHVGLPLALAFADRGARVGIYDVSEAAVDPAIVATAEHVVVVIGTPVDEHLNPKQIAITKALGGCSEFLRDGQLLVLRSTVFPGVTALVEKMMAKLGRHIEVAFCPERIAEGKAMTELFELPQIVSARTPAGTKRASALFGRLTGKIVVMTPEEAELAKLFTNVWRYIKFATANQLFMMANEQGLDFDRIRRGLAEDYPRAADMPAAGFAAGPCLFKDTMQLAAFNHNNFPLGHAAMLVNEGLPLHVVHRLEQRFDLGSMTVGILGMAFKAGSDDIRSSLSYKLKRILAFKADT